MNTMYQPPLLNGVNASQQIALILLGSVNFRWVYGKEENLELFKGGKALHSCTLKWSQCNTIYCVNPSLEQNNTIHDHDGQKTHQQSHENY